MKTTLIYTDLEFRAISGDTFPGVNVDAWERSNTINSTVDDDVELTQASRWPTSGLVDKRGQELVELKLQVLVEVKTSSG